ncbi:hypothetical protein K466DRAFT_489916 [Polyporus arcularius HHB13444]|uniref:LysM domain-containing protein n=1 Tax=Polyporus arcularius HHB13444 TaxID=1314778 RepID=A0A5C3PI35_9APHY|nr:hypothetical protein K466DRAFT_489916 [Polyporus arcularius HHB13444]
MPTVPISVSLCLACSGSLPPRIEEDNVFHTSCCSKPICPTCIAANPRLKRYNPCLLCLAGVTAVNSGAPSNSRGGVALRSNVDGSVRDEDIFVVQDEDEDSDLETEDGLPPSVAETVSRDSQGRGGCDAVAPNPLPPTQPADHPLQDVRSMPSKYFIRPHDTLLGISLKFGIDGRVLCRLNNLPASTLRTTPHLLHTRSFLVLPASVVSPPLTPAQQSLDEERRARLAVERAETRFQSMTKEADRDVAKAYVALAGLPDEEATAGDSKEYETEKALRKRRPYADAGLGGSSLEERAVDQFFDDEEWETRERAEGRNMTIPSFPYLDRTADKLPAEEQKTWWRWRN